MLSKVGWCLGLALSAVVISAPAAERQFFAHYMGCFPATSGWLARDLAQAAPLTNTTAWVQYGGAGWLNRPLMPFGFAQSAEADAALEIQRAIRAGIDGFAVDAWSGSNTAKQRFEQLMKAAEPYAGKFQITVCLDASCHSYGYTEEVPMWQRFADTANYLLQFSASPALARRDGKPLIFSYHSRYIAGSGSFEEIATAWQNFRQTVTNTVYLSGDIDYLVKWDDAKVDRAAAATFAAGIFEAVGGFLGVQGHWRLDPTVSDAVKAAGSEWVQPMFFQYQNQKGSIITDKGLDYLAGNWENARTAAAELIQFVTWNDYGEETTMAPTYGTGYTVTRLCRHWAEWWKTGVEPTVAADEVHVIFRRTANWTEESWPYAMRIVSNPPASVLEVATLLTAPGTVIVPGYGEYAAPRGLHRQQFALKPGTVRASVWRNVGGTSNEVCAVSAPECVADRRWREDYTLVAYGSNYEQEWEQDFPGIDPLRWSEMGDVDGDGMPNWFEMAFFGAYPDLSTAGAGDPSADPDADGATNLEEYQRGTHPLVADTAYPVGFTWDAAELKHDAVIWNPARDARGRRVWLALRTDGALAETPGSLGAQRLFYDGNFSFMSNGTVRIGGTVGQTHAFAWRAPEDGVYEVDLGMSVASGAYGPANVQLNIGNAATETLAIAKGTSAEWHPAARWLAAGETVKVTFNRSTTFFGPVDLERFRVTRVDRAPRRLTWADPEIGAFAAPTNWLIGGSAPIDGGPDAADTVVFSRSSGNCATTARLSDYTSVSNLLITAAGSKTDYEVTLDLNGHTLDVQAQMAITTRSYAPESHVTLRDGVIRVLGTATGTTTYGAPNEDAGGLFLNRDNSQQAMAEVTLERMRLSSKRSLWYQALGLQGRSTAFVVADGSVLEVPSLSLSVSDGESLFEVKGTGSALWVTNGQSTAAVGTGLVNLGAGTRLRLSDGGALRTRGLFFGNGCTIAFDGGNHVLTGVNNWGHEVAIGTGGTVHTAVTGATLAITNGATVEVAHAVKISGESAVQIAAGGALDCMVVQKDFVFDEGLSVAVDNGRIEADWITFGANATLNVVGSNAWVHARNGNRWGAKGGLAFGNGVRVRMELPRDGFVDAAGAARAPLISDGYCVSSVSETAPVLALATDEFDAAHPRQSLTLVATAGESSAALTALAAQVVWLDARHGQLSVSNDGRRLVYTASAPGTRFLLQ